MVEISNNIWIYVTCRIASISPPPLSSVYGSSVLFIIIYYFFTVEYCRFYRRVKVSNYPKV